MRDLLHDVNEDDLDDCIEPEPADCMGDYSLRSTQYWLTPATPTRCLRDEDER